MTAALSLASMGNARHTGSLRCFPMTASRPRAITERFSEDARMVFEGVGFCAHDSSGTQSFGVGRMILDHRKAIVESADHVVKAKMIGHRLSS